MDSSQLQYLAFVLGVIFGFVYWRKRREEKSRAQNTIDILRIRFHDLRYDIQKIERVIQKHFGQDWHKEGEKKMEARTETKKYGTLEDLVGQHGLGRKFTFGVWPKGKYFVPSTRINDQFAGTVYGCPDLDFKPTAVLKLAQGTKNWQRVQMKSVTLLPALVEREDGTFYVTRNVYESEAEARERFEGDDEQTFIKLLSERAIRVEIETK